MWNWLPFCTLLWYQSGGGVFALEAHILKLKWYPENTRVASMWGKHDICKILLVFWNSVFVDRKAQCHKDVSSPQIYKFNAIPVNSPVKFSIKPKELFLKFIWKSKGPKTARTILKKCEGWGLINLQCDRVIRRDKEFPVEGA